MKIEESETRWICRSAHTPSAEEEGMLVDDAIICSVLKDDALAVQASLWTYGCELVRRSQFASQRPAVHHLWLELDEKKKRRLNAEAIWEARSVLIQALEKKAAEYDHK